MRPQEKTPEIITAAEQYSNGGWREHGEAVPTVEGLALHLGKHRSTLYQWAAADTEFADILEWVKTQQAVALINGGLTGGLNPTITRLLLCQHGYSEKQAIDHTSGGKSMGPIHITRTIIDPVISREDIKAALASGLAKI